MQNDLKLLLSVRGLLLAFIVSVCAIPSLSAETLGVRYLNSPRSMKTFSYVTTQCAAHYLANATKVTDQLASKSGSTKDEAIVGADPILTTCADPKLTRGFC